jgi:hypothetical protein
MQVNFRSWNFGAVGRSMVFEGIHPLYAGKFQVLELWRGWEKHGFGRKNQDSGPRNSKKFQDLVVLIPSAANISLLSAAFRNLG